MNKMGVFVQPHVVNPSSVVYSNKWACVLDASICLNKYCVHRKTRLSDLSCIPLLYRVESKGCVISRPFSEESSTFGELLTLCWFQEIQKSSSGLIQDLVTNFGGVYH